MTKTSLWVLAVASAMIWMLPFTATLQTSERPTTIDAFYQAVDPTRVIAHRGFSGIAQENTLAASACLSPLFAAPVAVPAADRCRCP